MDVQVIVFWSRVVGAGLGGISFLLLVWAATRWRPGRTKRYCPGLRVRGVRRLICIAMPRVCGYDLAGLPEGVRGEVCCPECGRSLVVRKSGLRAAFRRRPGRPGAALAVAGAIVLCAPLLKTRSWQKLVPTTVLIGVKRVVGTERMPMRLKRELGKRLDRGGLHPWQERFLIPALQDDLRDDNRRGNASIAIRRLQEMGRPGLEAIERSLYSRDHQERQVAASVLRRRCWVETWKGRELVREPSDELLRASAEGLTADGVGWYDGMCQNAYEGFGFLLQFPDRAAPLVEEGLYSDDRQHRLLCASLALQLRRAELYPRAVPILTSHLVDNTIRRDARFAAATLAMMKADAVPFLTHLKATGDKQQRAVARLLLVRLEPGGRGWADERIEHVLETTSWPRDGQRSLSDVRWSEDGG